MLDMSLTLDVSKFSGWLNANAPCRVGREGIQKGAACGPGAGGAWDGPLREQCTGKGPTVGTGRQGTERTENMVDMVVTLDVSRLSGWSNASAYCRVRREEVQKGRRAKGGDGGREKGGCATSAAQAACRKPVWRWEARARSAPQTCWTWL